MSPFVSVIVPLYNEEQVIAETYSRLTSVLGRMNLDYEIVMVNDGSRDRTAELARTLCEKDVRVKLVSFSRNFGHQVAITAGMDKCGGQVAVIIDADLQDPPEIIPEMIERWREGYAVVYGVRKKRKGETLFKRATAAVFYRTLRRMSSVSIPLDTGDFRLMDRKVVEELKKMRERSRFMRGMVSWVGFKQARIEYEREMRFAGDTKYPFAKMLKLSVDAILSFSQLPLRISTVLGLLCCGISLIAYIYSLLMSAMSHVRITAGWTYIGLAILFIGGVQLVSVGLLGEYIGRMYEELKARPLYVIDEEINFE